MARFGQKDYSDNHDTKEVWLQNIGWQAAKYGHELQVGDFMVYNGGSASEIVKIAPSATGKTFTITTMSSGKEWTRRVNASALYAAQSRATTDDTFADTDDELWAAGGSPFISAQDDDTSTMRADFVREQYARADAEDMAENNPSPDATIPLEAPLTAQGASQDSTQLSSTMKATSAPVITKKQRRKDKQAAIRQQYAIAQEQKRIYRERGMAAVFEFARRMTTINSQMAVLDKVA
jgi:hypothetical protein